MTQEDKKLLFQDLCARLPYGVKVQDELGRVNKLVIGNADLIRLYYNDFSIYGESALSLPLLRQMSSMTEEEEEEYSKYYIGTNRVWIRDKWIYFDNYNGLEYLNKKMFDYRGLIKKGLALEAPEGMYNNSSESTITQTNNIKV